jgi:hypothetical protein
VHTSRMLLQNFLVSGDVARGEARWGHLTTSGIAKGGLWRRLAFKTYFRSTSLISRRLEHTFQPEV